MKKLTLFLILITLIGFLPMIFPQDSSWELRYPDIPTDPINDITFIDDERGFIVNSGGSVLLTTDGGSNWQIKAHYQRNIFSEIKFVDALNGFTISPGSYIGDDVQMIFTTDGGSSWDNAMVYMGNASTFIPLSTSMFLKSVDYEGTIMKLDDFNGNWVQTYIIPYFFQTDDFVPYGDIRQFQNFGNGSVLALGASWIAKQYGIISDSVSFFLKSDDYGSSWDTLWCDLSIAASSFYFIDSSTGWFGAEENHIYKTTDGGNNWTLQFSDTLNENKITSIIAKDEFNINAVSESGRFIFSNDGGANWNTIQVANSYLQKYTIEFINEQKGFLVGSDFWVTTDGGNNWGKVSKSINDLIWQIDFVNSHLGWTIGEDGIYKTEDGGYNWVRQYSTSGYSIDMLDSLNGWATSHIYVHKTTNGGESWETISIGNTIGLIRGIHFLNSDVGIIYDVWDWMVDSTINFVTTNGGETWLRYNIKNHPSVSTFRKMKFTDPEHLWFANQQGLWLSQDTGKTWILNETVEANFAAYDLYNSQICWLQEDFDNIAITSDGGITWERRDTPHSIQGTDMLIMGRDYFGDLNIFLSGMNGNLIEYNENPVYGVKIISSYTQNSLNSFSKYISGNNAHIWLAGSGFTILYKNNIVSDAEFINSDLPLSFSLSQNYPNPFNPTTKIKYKISGRNFVTIKVFDVLGNEVATLVNEESATGGAGEYEVEFSAKGLPSGIYFYQLQTEGYIETKKMLLLK